MIGYIYKIISPSTDKIYIGSTTKTLKQRFSNHKYDYGCSSEIILSLDDAVIECIEEVKFEDVKELRGRERFHIELNRDRCVNTQIPNRTMSEYYIDNAVKIKQYQVANAARLKSKTNCECGGKYTHEHKSSHFKTVRHQNYLSLL